MPEQEQQKQDEQDAAQQDSVLDSVQGQPWLQRDEWYICRVELGGGDYAELMACSGRITEELEDALEMVGQVMPEESDEDEASPGKKRLFDALKGAIQDGLPEQLWKKVDKLLTEHIRKWDLSELVDKHPRFECEPPTPGNYEADRTDERLEMFKSLPLPVLARLLYGLAWHSGNF